MSKTPFVARVLQSAGLFQKLVGSEPKANAFAELNNALADAQSVRAVSLDAVQELNARYGINLHRKFERELKEMYRSFLLFCLSDRQFTQEEVEDLWHIKTLFGISDEDHEGIYQEVAVETYKQTLEEVLADSKFTEEEKDRLEQLSAYLKIPEDTRKQTFDKTAGKFLQRKADEFTSDNLFSPDEEAELQALCRSLGVGLTLNDKTAASLPKMRMLWQIRNGNLPVLQVPINLQRGETCCYMAQVDWLETRRVTKRIGYSGPALRFKIMKGVYWKAGNYAVQRSSSDVLTKVDSGVVYLTNKRVIFVGQLKNQAIRLDKVLDITPYSDGVGLEKDSGKSPILGLAADVDVFVAVLSRLIQDNV